MDKKLAELSSALLDGELDAASQDDVVSSLLKDKPEALAVFARYRLIGDTLRGESPVDASTVAETVRGALREEPVVLAPAQRRSPRWLRPAAGAALAASVATAAILIAPGMMTSPTDGSMPQIVAEASKPRPPATLVAERPAVVAERPSDASAGRWQALDPALQARLNRLVIEHHEFAGRTGLNGPVSHVGLVNYDGR